MLKAQYNTNYGFHAVQQISRTYSFCITETLYLCNSEGRCFLFFFNKVSVIKKIICIKNKDTSVLKKIIKIDGVYFSTLLELGGLFDCLEQ